MPGNMFQKILKNLFDPLPLPEYQNVFTVSIQKKAKEDRTLFLNISVFF